MPSHCQLTLRVTEFLVLVVVGGAVYLGDGNALCGSILVGKLDPGGGQTLAVATPGGVKLHEGHTLKKTSTD